MANNKWLILDCNYLCHRAAHSTGELSYKGLKTGVIYGFLRDILLFQERFNTDKVAFCWDKGTSLREDLYPPYKQNRKVSTEELTNKEIKFWTEFIIQVKKLRVRYLKTIGFSNIFYQDGYESDDLIASICYNLPKGDEAIIISADQDLYQLLAHNISIYQPRKRKLFTLQDFRKQYEIVPEQWMVVKCLAGCSTDNVAGIRGVGEKTAIKYVTGQLKRSSRIHQKIERLSKKYIKRNHPLVVLPFEGTKVFKLKKHNHFSNQGWRKVMKTLGMKSLQKRNIFMKRKKGVKI